MNLPRTPPIYAQVVHTEPVEAASAGEHGAARGQRRPTGLALAGKTRTPSPLRASRTHPGAVPTLTPAHATLTMSRSGRSAGSGRRRSERLEPGENRPYRAVQRLARPPGSQM